MNAKAKQIVKDYWPENYRGQSSLAAFRDMQAALIRLYLPQMDETTQRRALNTLKKLERYRNALWLGFETNRRDA